MTTAAGLFRGTVSASGFVIDVAVIGEAEARRRVLALWARGTVVLRHDQLGWIVALAHPVEVRSELAPGLVLRSTRGGLAGVGTEAEPGTIAVPRAGGILRVPRDELEAVSLAGWFHDWSDVHRLEPLDAPMPPALTVEAAAVSNPDLRALAHLDTPRRLLRFPRLRRSPRASHSPGGPHRSRISSSIRWALAIAVLLLIVGAVVIAFDTRHPGHAGPIATIAPAPTSDLPPVTVTNSAPSHGSGSPALMLVRLIVIVGIFALLGRLRRRQALAGRRVAAATSGSPGTKNWFGNVARLIMRTPAKGFVSRKHERYLQRLTRQFERREWDDALREAIGLGDTGGRLNLRLPKRRDSLALTGPRGAGGSIYYGDTVRQHLRELYLRAVKQLELAGRIEEAAFAQAELLRDVAAAAGLLERHGRWTLAAQLAEARELPPEMVVRLWWRAGDRRRALEVARTRGAFAAAIARLGEVDPAAASGLRGEWVRACRDAGDYVTAVNVAWPDETLRAQSRDDLMRGLALGGEVRARLLVHLISAFADDAAPDEVRELLEGAGTQGRDVRRTVLVALAELPALDRSDDRKLCTAALRSLLRDPAALDEIGAKTAHRIVQSLRSRADPLMNADMPEIRPRRAEIGAALVLSLPEEAGQLPVLDAVMLADDSILVALGGYGARLLTPDGRVRARWDIPTHQLVVADHGGTILLVTQNGEDREIHRLDVGTRSVRRWTTLRVSQLLPSFDGGVLPVVDDDGIAFFDTTAGKPRIIWRELDTSQKVLRIGRTPTALTALVRCAPTDLNPNAVDQLWSWDLPTLTLRSRADITLGTGVQDGAISGDGLFVLDTFFDSSVLQVYRRYEQPRTTGDAPAGSVLMSSGAALALLTDRADGTIDVVVRVADRVVIETQLAADGKAGLRMHKSSICLWDGTGRVRGVSLAGPAVRANIRTTI